MVGEEAAAAALLGATALHAGFQATVTVLVYPALARVSPEEWAEVHDRHSRRIIPVVGGCYGALVAASVWVVVSGAPGLAAWLAVASALTAIAVTALVAAPTHGRLGREGPQPALLARLLRADRLRFVAAVAALLAAAGATFWS